MSDWPRPWCEACQDHFDVKHYDDDGFHKIGAEFGPVGEDAAELARLRDIEQRAQETVDGHPECDPWSCGCVTVARYILGGESETP